MYILLIRNWSQFCILWFLFKQWSIHKGSACDTSWSFVNLNWIILLIAIIKYNHYHLDWHACAVESKWKQTSFSFQSFISNGKLMIPKKNQLGHFKKCDYIHVNKIQEKQQKQNKMPAWSLPTPVPTSALRKNPWSNKEQ